VTEFQRSVFKYAPNSAGLSNLRVPEPAPSVRFVCAGVRLNIPENFEGLPLSVIFNAGETDERAVARLDGLPDVLDQIETLADPR
jgi:hypothetical protein